MKGRRLVFFLLAVASVVALLWFGIANPFNFFVPRSSRFSTSGFREIKLGTPIGEVVKLLGEPVKVVKGNRFDPACVGCVAFCFMGEPPGWVVSFQEAWIIADQRGHVVRVFFHAEP
ncbi:MAG: hypothetical protein ABI163_12500 [Thermoanaerobaculia bacterium]